MFFWYWRIFRNKNNWNVDKNMNVNDLIKINKATVINDKILVGIY